MSTVEFPKRLPEKLFPQASELIKGANDSMAQTRITAEAKALADRIIAIGEARVTHAQGSVDALTDAAKERLP